MAAKSQADAKRKYSWWWDSHISPKNSKWLQENLTDMDSKVKQMIKVIEEDADSFARRAEMYYKKRPELMKLVEEFYRAYRALAERYDHATGVIRQAQRTMAEAFPNQVPMLLADDFPTVPSMEAEARTPEMSHSSLAFSDHDEVRKDSSRSPSPNFHAIKRNGGFTEEPDSAGNRKGLKQLNDLFMPGAGRARKELNFHDVDNDNNNKNDGNLDSRAQDLSESERVTRAEAEILALKRALAKLENEKEAGLLQYQQSLERLSNLESEVSHAQENSQELNERASKAEAEVQTLKETLNRLQGEREVSLLQYQLCLEKVSNLEKKISSTEKNAGELNERVIRAETEAESLKKDLITVEAEKEAALDQYEQCLETVSKLEDRLVQAEENARKINEQANKAGNEIEALKLEIAKLTEENEDAALRYQQCLEIISSLEHKLSCAEEEVRRLNSKIDDSTEKLLSSEQKCLLLETSNENIQAELQSLVQKLGCQNEELSEKQQELGKLWNCIQEERLRFVEAETAFQTLQNLHSQSQEELRSIAAELHHKAELLENVEFHKQALEDEVQKVKQENKILNEFKISSSLSTKNLQDEILNLRQTIEKLEQEVELRVDERNALQQEIYCLKEELSDVNKRHDDMIEEVSSTGLDPQCFGLSVKELQDENAKLKETCEADRGEKAVLLEKLQIMEKLLEKNTVLENSLSDLNVELESVRGKVQLLEETCQSLLGEKSTLIAEKATLFSQLQTMTGKLENVSEKNNLLENSLFDANAELEGLKEKSKGLEGSYQSLDLEKSNLISEKETLAQQLNIAHQMLKSIENQHRELELKHLELKGEKESALQKVEELLVSFYAEREEHSRIVQLNERHLAEKELQLHIAQEDANCRKKEYEEELDRAAHAEIEIFLLQKCIQDLEENNFSLLVEYQRLLEKYKISEKLVSNLENENVQKQVQMNCLFGRITVLRTGLLQGLKTLDLNSDHSFDDMAEQDHILLDHMHGKIQERQECLDTIFNESQHLAIENSVLVIFLGQLKLKAEKLVTERDSLDEELRIQSEQFLALQAEVRSIQEKNQELKLTISKGEQRIEEMATKTGDLLKQLSDLELAHKNLQDESCKTVEENNSLMRRFVDLGEEKKSLEEEICDVIHETIAQSNISLIYQDIVFEKVLALRELSEDLGELCSVNEDLKNRLKAMTEKLEDVQMENSHLKESFDRSSIELKSVQSVNDQLGCQIQKGKELLSQKENELLAAAEMFSALHTEKTELQKMLEDLRCKYEEARVILDDQARQILNLSSDKDRQNEELRCLREVNQKLESEMGHLCEELKETRLREEKLNYQLKEETNEIDLWETQAATLYEEVQRSSAKETLIEGKFREVTNTCESQNEELRCLHEVNQKLESEMGQLCQELEETRLREEKLNYQLKEGTNEIELWETQAATLYEEVQRSTANETLIEGKFRELANTCEGQSEELRYLHEVNQNLESEMGHICKELEETRPRVEKLNYQLREGTNEIELWETQAAALYEEVQRSTASETLIEGKFREVANTCESLEREHNNKSVEGEKLKERVSELEDQNGRLRDQLAAYVPAVSALKDCITSLEMQTLVHTELQTREKSKEDMMNHQYTEGGPQTSANQLAAAPDALPDIQEMQKKISAIEMAVKHLNKNFKPRDELREIQELQSSNHGTRINEGTINKQKTGKSIPDIPAAESEVLTKDIILDQMSESSSYGISRRGTPDVDDHMLQLWETVNKQQKATTGPANYRQKGVTNEPKNNYPTIESLVEKELSVDKLEISRRLTQPREEDNKPKIIERLDSDAQKLADLKITVQDLIKKVGATEKSTKGKGSEYDSVKGQLEVTEESVNKLFDANRKLMKNVEEGKLSFVENPEPESDESGSISRRRASEQARRGSEKIGRLQLEVQRLQFLLLKLDEERESKGKAKMTDRSPRVLLRDYLYGYGGTRSNPKKKRSHFCSCVHPPTKGD
ncbi:hypothetical protein K1719_013155 [Acacia pycnantha]|nr:hypothetical protein K1719_013155 [Acacia pycnantha]